MKYTNYWMWPGRHVPWDSQGKLGVKRRRRKWRRGGEEEEEWGEKEGKDVTEAKSHRGVSREGILQRGSNRFKRLNQEWVGFSKCLAEKTARMLVLLAPD